MEKQTGSVQIIIIALLILVIIIGAGYYFLAPTLLNRQTTPPIVAPQNILPARPTVTVAPTPASTDSGQLVPDINNQTDLDKVSNNLDNTNFNTIDSNISQNSSDAASF